MSETGRKRTLAACKPEVRQILAKEAWLTILPPFNWSHHNPVAVETYTGRERDGGRFSSKSCYPETVPIQKSGNLASEGHSLSIVLRERDEHWIFTREMPKQHDLEFVRVGIVDRSRELF